jgi:orotidine-5'-phosphate decarboxylase
MTEIAIAFDVPTLDGAIALDERLGPGPEIAKVGLELFAAVGPEAVRALKARGRRVFLDLKLHDIPNTVRGAARSAARLGADLVTVHALGGAPMVAAAVAGAREGGETRVVAVTLLTSLDAFNLPPGLEQPLHTAIVISKMVRLAEAAGAWGVVCSAADVPGVRAMLGRPFTAVTPGIRPAGGARHDQARVATLADAVRAGAAMVVLGRAVTSADDPREALTAARAERDSAATRPVA